MICEAKTRRKHKSVDDDLCMFSFWLLTFLHETEKETKRGWVELEKLLTPEEWDVYRSRTIKTQALL